MDESAKLRLFEQTMVPHLNAAYNLARWIVRRPEDAEDAVQEAYIRAFKYFDGFQGANAQAWLMAIVRNTCLTRMRGVKETAPFDERIHAVSNPAFGAEAALVQEADLGELRKCIEGLPVEYRETVVMRELQELSYKEIAEVAAVPVGTIMSRLSRARKRLEECMRGRK